MRSSTRLQPLVRTVSTLSRTLYRRRKIWFVCTEKSDSDDMTCSENTLGIGDKSFVCTTDKPTADVAEAKRTGFWAKLTGAA